MNRIEIPTERRHSIPQEGVQLLAPTLRSFSELPGWLASHRAELADRRILMYCTGGVRCERASAYLRSLGPAFQDVFQLSGAPPRHPPRVLHENPS